MVSTGMPLDAACLLAMALEGIVYGFSILMFVGTIWSLTYKQRTQDIDRPMLAVAILLLILSTGHMVANIIRMEDGLVKYRDTYPGGPVAYFADPAQKMLAIMHVFYVLQTLLADGVVIYRCYVVWRSVWIIILPSMLWCSVAVTGAGVIYSYLQATGNSMDFYANLLGGPTQWVTAYFASTMATNGLSSGLLAYRIWMIERNVSGARATKGTLMPIVRVLVDAAVLYTVILVISLICFLLSNNGMASAVDMITSIISIAFYMGGVQGDIGRSISRSHDITKRFINTHHISLSDDGFYITTYTKLQEDSDAHAFAHLLGFRQLKSLFSPWVQ
ncbi:hypothetical protein DEU56DRAFT_971983 [Suillus clintonianus]|uniref:uncharacterized protein n=1 Tax=Suillus clintonianus TaxID=1904413 RepID=UPI001B85D12C|nr:uncharacterized protein DEU56DRAFT_971983 [Suillus clintonianus]KAG2142361.1 hypothetical protein DEU56DRAFT_971983 [Suillus clintonianus]